MRIGKIHPSPFSDDAVVADWYHPDCFFEAMLRTLAKTVVPMSAEDFKGWETMSPADEAWLQPMLDEFVGLRKQKLAGKLPGKSAKLKNIPAHLASNKGSHMISDDEDEFAAPPPKAASNKTTGAPTPSKKLAITSSPLSKSPKPPTPATPSDKYGLTHILDKKWQGKLMSLIKVLPEVDSMLSTFTSNVPSKAKIFESLNGLDPALIQLVVIKDKPFTDTKAASGYAFHNCTDKTLAEANSQLSGFLRAARSHSNAQGNLVDWETYNTRTPQSWYAGVKHQGVLMLNAQLSIDPASATTTSTLWDAVLLKILKTIFIERKKAGKGGIVVVFCGKNLDQIRRSTERIFTRFQPDLNGRFLSLPLPDDPDFTSTDNPFETIDALLLETACSPPKWFPEEELAKPEEVASTSAWAPAPVKTSKMTSRIQLTSLDGKANLDVGKFHRDPSSPGSFIMRAVDLDAGEQSNFLSSHVAKFVIGKGGDLTITPLTSNGIFHGDAVNFTPTELAKDEPSNLKRGDILGFLGADFKYRIDPYDFDNPPTNKYHSESGAKSMNSSMMEEEEERAQDAKRPMSDTLDTDHEMDAAKPSAKKAKKAAPAMDWMEDEGGELEPGDYEYKPNKHDETASDYVIDDGEENHNGDGDSGSEDVDELMVKQKPMCQYGASCYRKNPQHLAQFRHPPKG